MTWFRSHSLQRGIIPYHFLFPYFRVIFNPLFHGLFAEKNRSFIGKGSLNKINFQSGVELHTANRSKFYCNYV